LEIRTRILKENWRRAKVVDNESKQKTKPGTMHKSKHFISSCIMKDRINLDEKLINLLKEKAEKENKIKRKRKE
jgi:hypothetical protein